MLQNLPAGSRALIWCAVSTTQQVGDDRASMDEQERWAINVCRDNEWQVVEVLRVPGHSRNYKDLNVLASDARAKGINAFDRLIAHLEQCDFDVFLCRDANRFARRASLLHYLIESIVEDCNAVIYSQHDGWITRENMSGFAALKGYSTAQDISWIRKGMEMGKKKRVARGLPSSGVLSSSHKVIRNPETGKSVALVINDAMKHLYDCMGELVLDGYSWNEIGVELYKRWKYTTSKGKFHSANGVYYRMYNPLVWGNLTTGRNDYPIGEWVFYDHYSKPDGLEVQYGIIEPMYKGKFADDIRHELIRRLGQKGKTKARDTYRFSNTCVCGICGGNMNVGSQKAPKRGYVKSKDKERKLRITEYGTVQWGLKCRAASERTIDGERCCTNTPIYQATLEKFWTDYFYWLADGKHIGEYFNPDWVKDILPQSSSDINAKIKTVEGQIKTLITQQSLAPEVAQSMYRDQIFNLSEQLQTLREDYNAIASQEKTIINITPERLKAVQIEHMWQWDDLRINKFLRMALGPRRLVVVGDKVVGMKIV